MFNLYCPVAAGRVGVFSPLAGEGLEVHLVMVTCTQSWFPGVMGVELFNGDVGIVEIFSGVPDLVVFWRVTDPPWHGTRVCLGEGESQ